MLNKSYAFRSVKIFIFIALLGRLILLEYTDLIDPTETRYATVAQLMLITGDWVIPKLPMPEGIVPYMSKPPLFYWLAASAYSAFGIEEWTARLPSFISACLILWLIYEFSLRQYDKQIALAASLIALSSAVFYFLAGACVIDMTFSALVLAALLSVFWFINNESAKTYHIYIGAIFCGLAFLCKGPFALVLTVLPLVLWSILCRDYSWLRRVPWLKCVLLVSVVNLPWLILSELRSPGSLQYFFWNENLARYFLRDYGDRFGSGHVHTYGMSWLMLLLIFAPWTFVFAWIVWRIGVRDWWQWVKHDRVLVFLFCCTISAPLFLTFMRQLHAMYLLPSLPSLSILTAVSIRRFSEPLCVGGQKLKGFLRILPILVWVVVLGVGLALKYSLDGLYISAALLTVLIAVLDSNQEIPQGWLQLVSYGAVVSIGCYLFVISTFTPYLNQQRSAEDLIKFVASSERGSNSVPSIAVSTRNSFSHYWVANAWQAELSKRVAIVYVAPETVPVTSICSVLVKSKSDQLEDVMKRRFWLWKQSGDWLLLRRRSASCLRKMRTSAVPGILRL